MKKIAVLITVLFVLTSCTEEIKTNSPALQALKDDVLWRGIDMKAYKSDDGSVRIVALSDDGNLTLNISNSNVGTYYLGSVNNNFAVYNYTANGADVSYSTNDLFGPLLNLSNLILAKGSNYEAGNQVNTTSSNGGFGMKVNTSVNENGEIIRVTISNPGSGYEVGDVITVSGGDGKAKFKILSEIKVTDYSNGLITGYFKFTAKNIFYIENYPELINFQYGAFYKIPVEAEP